MNVFGIGSGINTLSGDVNFGDSAQQLNLNQALDRIAVLERELAVTRKNVDIATKNTNGAKSIALALLGVVEKEVPTHPLTVRANRDKIYDANWKL